MDVCRGGRAALLEATRVGRGTTAASTALLMQEPDKEFSGPMCRDTSRAPLKADPTYVANPYATPR